MVPRPQLHRSKRTILAAGARTNCNYLSLHRLFFCCFGDDDAARSLLFTLDSTDKHPVAQRPKGHEPLRGLQFNVIDGYPSLRRHVFLLLKTTFATAASHSVTPIMLAWKGRA